MSNVRSIFVPLNKKPHIYENLSTSECGAQCLHNETNCISAYYKEDGSCLLYTNDATRNYVTVAAENDREHLFMVTCLIEKAPNIKVDSYWISYKETTITESGILTNRGYPLTYAYNSFFRWKIDLPEKYVILQFMDISLRKFETHPVSSSNVNMCDDTIILESTDTSIRNPLQDFKRENTATHHTIDSDYTGRMPAFSMGGLVSRTSNYVTFYSCSVGSMLNSGRGFRVHLSGTERPFCLDNAKMSVCLFPGMELMSHKFLGRYDLANVQQETHTWLIIDGSLYSHDVLAFDSLLMTLEFKDFDISCHSESVLEVVDEFGNKHVYCNNNRPYGKQLTLRGYIKITYTPNRLQSAVDTYFPEGFHLSYRCIPMHQTLPYNLSINTGNLIFLSKSANSENLDIGDSTERERRRSEPRFGLLQKGGVLNLASDSYRKERSEPRFGLLQKGGVLNLASDSYRKEAF
ncbi:uncharacterized protein LOC123533202 [Mercenaria mercenaria]|uniref:uncharacterized protein LOC123533202 n=1 Tax=Mercenaria mercenaria TaxID=6596 RepID=UPI00234F8BDA|nr:uncharacterized protein LOC123533202 [Mercenaria mercenaria]